MLDQLKVLWLFYVNPRRAASQALDNGRLGFALVAAFLTALAIQAPHQMARQRFLNEIANIQEEADSEKRMSPEQRIAAARIAAARALDGQESEWIGFQPSQALTELFVALGIFVPLGIAIIAAWQGPASPMVTVQREFGSLLLCTAFAWTAARLPMVPIRLLGPEALRAAAGWLWLASSVYFLVLCAACFRTSLGAQWAPAGVTASIAAFLFAAGRHLPISLSPMMYMVASPCLLYYFWGRISSEAALIGSSVSSRQSFRRAIEATTINPRDADAHYQLGLVQVQRRNWTEAESRFRAAVGIDPGDADYCFQLGCVLREEGRDREALEWLQRAARLNDKTSSSEVWREIGAAQIGLEDWTNGLASLGRYVARREYDPVGLVYLGEALAHQGRTDEARQMFERALESFGTMPRHRRGELRSWSSRALGNLRRLKIAKSS